MNKILMALLLGLALNGCGLHANPTVWSAHDRLFVCQYSQAEPRMSPASQRLAMTSARQPQDASSSCDHWAFSGSAPRRMVYDCIEYISDATTCNQFTSRMFQCDACYVAWREGRQ